MPRRDLSWPTFYAVSAWGKPNEAAIFQGDYDHQHRTHQSLARDCPVSRPVELIDQGKIVEFPKVGGLHHRYTRRAA